MYCYFPFPFLQFFFLERIFVNKADLGLKINLIQYTMDCIFVISLSLSLSQPLCQFIRAIIKLRHFEADEYYLKALFGANRVQFNIIKALTFLIQAKCESF